MEPHAHLKTSSRSWASRSITHTSGLEDPRSPVAGLGQVLWVPADKKKGGGRRGQEGCFLNLGICPHMSKYRSELSVYLPVCLGEFYSVCAHAGVTV